VELRFKILCDESNIRIDQYLVSVFPDISRSKFQTAIKSKALYVNGVIVKPGTILNGGEEITCEYSNIPDDELIPQFIDLNILFEDEDIVVINKQPGLVVHPGSGNWDQTLANGLVYHFQSLAKPESDRPGIVHRLDKETSGVIVVAKNDFTHHHLSQQFMKRDIHKEYKALVWGTVQNSGRIECRIGRHPKNRHRFTTVNTGGRNAITRYEPMSIFPPLTWMSLFPETGRTHQLRVQMKEIGHPIIHDTVYGGDLGQIKSYHEKYTRLIKSVFRVITRTALHAYSIQFTHPRKKTEMMFTADLPADIDSALDILRTYDK